MSYIEKYEVVVPRFTVNSALLDPHTRPAKRCICYTDEDLITLAYSAATKLLEGSDAPDAILFATSTPLFQSRYHASFLAGLLGIPDGLYAMDIVTTERAGTDALLLADKLVHAGQYKRILLVVATVDFPDTETKKDMPLSHAAIAMLITGNKGAVEITDTRSFSSSMTEDFIYKKNPVQYDARFSRNAGFKNCFTKAWSAVSPDPENTTGLIINSLYAKMVNGIVSKSGFKPEQLTRDTIFSRYGYTGACHALLLMINSMASQEGNYWLFDYRNGINAIGFKVHKTTRNCLPGSDHFMEVKHISDYQKLLRQGDFNHPGYKQQEMFSSEMMYEREKDKIIFLKGTKCMKCNSVYLLGTRFCPSCGSDEFTAIQLSKTGVVYTLTAEYYFPSSFPPIYMVVIDLDGGGRITVQQTDDLDKEGSKLKIGDRVKLVLRSMIENGTKPDYFWKCIKTDE